MTGGGPSPEISLTSVHTGDVYTEDKVVGDCPSGHSHSVDGVLF